MNSKIKDISTSVHVQCLIDVNSVKVPVHLSPDYNTRKTLDDLIKVSAYVGSSIKIRVEINNSIDVIGFAIHGQTRQCWALVSFDHILKVLCERF